MLLRDRKMVVVLGIVCLAVFLGSTAAFACTRGTEWTAADQKKSKKVLEEVMRDFDDLAAAKKRLDENPDDAVAKQVAKNALDKIEKMVRDAHKDDLADARNRGDRVAVSKLTKARSKLLSIERDAKDMAAEMEDGMLGPDESEEAEEDYGREEALADMEGSYSGVFSSDFSKIEADLRDAFAAQKDPNLSNSQEQQDRVASIQSQLAEIRDEISIYSISPAATKEEIEAANARAEQLERAASAI